LADDVLDSRQVLLGGFEPQLSFMTACMQAGNASGFFEDAAVQGIIKSSRRSRNAFGAGDVPHRRGE
jgi:hypothetical protein